MVWSIGPQVWTEGVCLVWQSSQNAGLIWAWCDSMLCVDAEAMHDEHHMWDLVIPWGAQDVARNSRCLSVIRVYPQEFEARLWGFKLRFCCQGSCSASPALLAEQGGSPGNLPLPTPAFPGTADPLQWVSPSTCWGLSSLLCSFSPVVPLDWHGLYTDEPRASAFTWCCWYQPFAAAPCYLAGGIWKLSHVECSVEG